MKNLTRAFRGILLAGVALVAPEVLAWGADGHRVVGEIAWHYLEPEVKIEVRKLLRVKAEPNLAEATTWADRIRSDSDYDWAAPLHYISLPREWSGYREQRDCPQAGCILKALDHFSAVLADHTASENTRAEALLFVAHFVGDLHQPLHTGLASDRGGNDIQVTFFDVPTNLHALWDVYLPDRFIEEWGQYAKRQIEQIDPQQAEQWLTTQAPDWAAESHRLVHSHAYTTESALGEDYYQRNRAVVAKRLRQGGVRLAGTLNRILSAQ